MLGRLFGPRSNRILDSTQLHLLRGTARTCQAALLTQSKRNTISQARVETALRSDYVNDVRFVTSPEAKLTL